MTRKYSLQYSISTMGGESAAALQELRNKLAELEGQSLRSVYREFSIAAFQGVRDEDVLTKVGLLRRSRVEGKMYSFFVLCTETAEVPHMGLWASVCRTMSEKVRLDVLGSSDDGTRICKALFVPPGLEFFNWQDVPEDS